MPHTTILHHGYLSPDKVLDLSLLPRPGYYKVVAVQKTRRSRRGTTIHVSPEIRNEINALVKSVQKTTGNKLNQDDVIAHLLAAYKYTGAALCDW